MTRVEHACSYPGDEPNRYECHDPAVHMLMAAVRKAVAERDALRAKLLAVAALAETKPGATGRALRAILTADAGES